MNRRNDRHTILLLKGKILALSALTGCIHHLVYQQGDQSTLRSQTLARSLELQIPLLSSNTPRTIYEFLSHIYIYLINNVIQLVKM